MKHWCLAWFLVLNSQLWATEVVISLGYEARAYSKANPPPPKTGTQRVVLNVEARTVAPFEGTTGEAWPVINRYEVRGNYIVHDLKVLRQATHLLAQGAAGGYDVIVFHRGTSSFGSPIKILKAVAGYPAQVEEAWIALVQNDKIKWSHRLEAIPESSVKFEARLYSPEKSKRPDALDF